MLCPKCQGKTRIVFSVEQENDSSNSGSKELIDKGERVFGWWTDEFCIHKRVCNECNHEFVTIEIIIDDLADAQLELAREGLIWPIKELEGARDLIE